MSEIYKRAIESAKCRIYRISANMGESVSHQIKAKKQIEIQEATIEALEKQIPKKMFAKPHTHLDLTSMFVCPCCETEYNRFYEYKKYCMECGQKLDWGSDNEID